MSDKVTVLEKQALPEETFMGEMEIGGQKRPVAMNLNTVVAAEELMGDLGVRVFATGTTKARDVRALLWAALREGSRLRSPAKKPDPRITLELVGSWMSTSTMTTPMVELLTLLGKMRGADKNVLAPYVPTPPEVIEKALSLAAELITINGFADLGCGPGDTLVAAATYGASNLLGVESDKDRATLAKAKLITANYEVGDHFKFEIIEGLIQDLKDLSAYDVVFIYLLQDSNQQIKEQLQSIMKQGAILISHDFTMVGWDPVSTGTVTDPQIKEREHQLYLYRISPTSPEGPAPVSGTTTPAAG
jgi:predicted O-methyltransferase YrrM